MLLQVFIDHPDVGSNLKRLFKYLVIDLLKNKLILAVSYFPGFIDQPTGQLINFAFW